MCKCEHIQLKTDLTTDHAAKAGTARPSATDLSLQKQVAVFIADGDATSSIVSLIVGIERTRESSRRGAGVGIGDADGLHWRANERVRFSKGGYDMC